MEDLDNENEFVVEQVQEIVRNAMEMTLGNVSYNKEKVNGWCSSIMDLCLKELSKLMKPFKYVVTCVIMQKNGCGLQSAATAFWDSKTDGLCSVQVGNMTLDCMVTVFAMAI
eukprot:GILK01001561.1.p2 GENE.GILK01001561.1~~GILK01001561.1.p2  ORF type:complete len:112 (-),score=17.95 GILK01001561.1:227-562(-)